MSSSDEDHELRHRPMHLAWTLPPLDETQQHVSRDEADERVVTPAKSRRRETR